MATKSSFHPSLLFKNFYEDNHQCEATQTF